MSYQCLKNIKSLSYFTIGFISVVYNREHQQICDLRAFTGKRAMAFIRFSQRFSALEPNLTEFRCQLCPFLASCPTSLLYKTGLIKSTLQGFPGGAVVENLPANAGDRGSSPGPEKSHMPQSNKACAPQLLSLRPRAHEPQLLSPRTLEPMLHNKRSHCNEKPAHHNEEEPPLAATRESPRTVTKT